MKNIFRAVLLILMLLSLLVLVPSGVIVAEAEVIELPLDMKEGIKNAIAPHAESYLSDWEYEDPSLSIKIEQGRTGNTNYLVARVKIANATQIRSMFTGSYNSPSEEWGTTLAKNAKAVLAVSGDSFHKHSNIGYVARQGKVYRNKCDRTEDKSGLRYDVLLIDDQGDLHILPQATTAQVDAFPGTVVNGFTFGPGLVIDGEKQSGFVNMNNASDKPAQRMCIAQVGPLEYLCIYTEGPEDEGSVGLTLEEFADFVFSFEGVRNAYNLDGGVTTWMVFRQGNTGYAKINGTNPKKRPIADILYFASAWQE